MAQEYSKFFPTFGLEDTTLSLIPNKDGPRAGEMAQW